LLAGCGAETVEGFDMAMRKVTLRQVRSKNHRSGELHELSEGQKYKGFVIEDVEEVECTHPERRWSLDNKISDEPPTAVGLCQVCGDEVFADLDEVELEEK
jgi:hypothetical protein